MFGVRKKGFCSIDAERAAFAHLHQECVLGK